RNDRSAMTRLKEAAEKAKIELSTLLTTDIDLPFIASDSSGPKHLHVTLTRAKLEDLAGPIVKRVETPIRRTLQDATIQPKNVAKFSRPQPTPRRQSRFTCSRAREPWPPTTSRWECSTSQTSHPHPEACLRSR